MQAPREDLIRQAREGIWRLFEADLIDEDMTTAALLAIALGLPRGGDLFAHYGDEQWEFLEEHLESPENPRALQRIADLKLSGWEVVSVQFHSGRWSFRRRRDSA